MLPVQHPGEVQVINEMRTHIHFMYSICLFRRLQLWPESKRPNRPIGIPSFSPLRCNGFAAFCSLALCCVLRDGLPSAAASFVNTFPPPMHYSSTDCTDCVFGATAVLYFSFKQKKVPSCEFPVGHALGVLLSYRYCATIIASALVTSLVMPRRLWSRLLQVTLVVAVAGGIARSSCLLSA